MPAKDRRRQVPESPARCRGGWARLTGAISRCWRRFFGLISAARAGWGRPCPRFCAWKVELRGLEGSQSQVATPVGDRLFQLPLTGLGVDPDLVQAAAHGTAGAFDASSRCASATGRRFWCW
jgi:hypothetical protein